MAKKNSSKHGGKRPNAGRKPKGNVSRVAKLTIRTTPTTATWFKGLASDHGGNGPALEHLHKKHP